MSKNIWRESIHVRDEFPVILGKASTGIVSNRTLYLSGIGGLLPNTYDKIVKGGIAAETKQALQNVKAALKEAKSDFHKVVKMTILLTNMDDLKTVDEICENFFETHFPARTVYQVPKLRWGAHVEIDIIAITDDVKDI